MSDCCAVCFAWVPSEKRCKVLKRTTEPTFYCKEFWRDKTRAEPQPSLFDAAAAEVAKREGMSRSEAHAAEGWGEAMLLLVREIAARQKLFTSDDVFELAATRGIEPTHDSRAFGPVMMRAAKRQWCKKADLPAVNSRRATLHASPRQVWESLVADV